MHCTESVALYNKLICLVSDEEFELEEVFKFYTKESEKLILKNWGKTAKLLIQNPQLKYCRHCFNSNVIIVDQVFRESYQLDLFQIEFPDETASNVSYGVGDITTSAEPTSQNQH